MRFRGVLKTLGKSARVVEAHRSAAESARERFQRRLGEIVELDFFGAPGREATTSLLASLELRLRQPVAAAPPEKDAAPRRVKGAVWVTRKGVHVDRIASAWLIKRFIDRDRKAEVRSVEGTRARAASCASTCSRPSTPTRATAAPSRCWRGGSDSDAAVAASRRSSTTSTSTTGSSVGRRPPGVARLINGIALTQSDDGARIALGSQVFDALYEAWRRKRS